MSVRSSIKIADQQLLLRILSKFSKSNVFFEIHQNMTSIFIKILVTYFQIVASIGTFGLNIPNSIVYIESVGNPIERILFSSDCFLSNLSKKIKPIYLKSIFGILLPFFFIILFFVGYFSYIKFKKEKFRPSIISSAVLFIFIYLQPNLISQLISIVSCKKVTGIYFIKADVSYLCYTKRTFNLDFFIYSTFYSYYWNFYPCWYYYLFTNSQEKIK